MARVERDKWSGLMSLAHSRTSTIMLDQHQNKLSDVRMADELCQGGAFLASWQEAWKNCA